MPQTVQFRRAMEAVAQISDEAPPWEAILSTARDLVGADSGSLIMMDGQGSLLNLNLVDISDDTARDYAGHFHKLDVLSEATVGLSPGIWLDSNELFPLATLQRTEFYTDYLRKHNQAQILGFLLEQNAERRTAISFQRSSIQEGVRPSLYEGEVGAYIRSFSAALARRSQTMTQNLQLLEETFSAIGEATMLVSGAGIVLRASILARALLDRPKGLSIKHGKLWHPSEQVAKNLSAAIAAVLQTQQRSRMTVPLSWGEILSLDIAVANARIRLADEPLVFIRMRCNSAMNEVEQDNLIATFGITKAEAKMLAGLVAGLAPADLAVQNSVSEHTVRSHITNLKRKMHCNRIVDLVKLALLAQA